MAIRINGTGEYLRRTTSLPDVAAYSACGWCKLGTERNWYALFSLDDGSSNYMQLALDDTSPTRKLVCSSSTGGSAYGAFASRPTNATWFFWAISNAGAGANNAKLFWSTGGSSAFVTLTLDGTADFSPTGMYIGNDGFDDYGSGAYAFVKVWDAVLTEAEFWQEMQTARPQRTANLHMWAPLLISSDGNDYSGNGRNLTTGGTLDTEDGPPVSWGVRPWVVPFVAASGTTYNQSADGTVTTAGALVRSARKPVAGTLTTAGALAKRTAKSMAGTLTTAGALVTSRLYSQVVAGTLTTAGALARQTNKTLAGALTTAGAIVRSIAKSLAGALTTAGALATSFISGSATFTQAVGGTLTTAGALSRSTSKVLAGTLTAAGDITKRIAKSLAGTLTTAGALVREWFSPSAAKVDVTLTDARVYTCTLTDARVYTCTLADALTYSVTLGDSTT